MELVDKIATLLHRVGRTPDDVIWMGTQGPNGFRQTWEEFVERVPTGVDYNILDADLVVVGKDWWMEYDVNGEGWDIHVYPLMPDAPRTWTLDLRGQVVDAPDQTNSRQEG